jgi:CHAT domain-containing protein/Flp pilus assembly protein TadD
MMPRASLFICLLSLTIIASAQTTSRLESGRPIERALKSGEKHSYLITAPADNFLQVIVEQRGIEVQLALHDTNGKELFIVDESVGLQGSRSLSHLATTAGELRIEIRTEGERSNGRYEVRLNTLRTATPDDRNRVAAITGLAEATKLLDNRDPAVRRTALEKAQNGLSLWKSLADSAGQANALFTIGLIHEVLNEREKAFASYQQALPLWRAAADPYQAGVTLNKLGFVANLLNQKQEAIDYLTQALAMRRTAKDRDGEAVTLTNLGAIFSNLGEKRKALDYHQQSLRLKRAQEDREGEARSLNNIGVVYRDLGEKRKALEVYEQALRLRRAVKDRDGEAVTLSNLGVIYLDLGEPQRALDALTQALPLRRTPATRAQTLNNLGRAYDLLGLSPEALTNYNQALALFREAKEPRGEAQTLNYIGLAQWALGDYPAAGDSLNQALRLRREVKDKPGEAATLNNLGLVYDATGEKEQARQIYQQAATLFREISNPQGEAYALNNLGFVSEALGDITVARDSHTRSIELSRRIGDRMREAKARYGLARLERTRGRLGEARKEAEATIKIVELLRTKLTSPELRASYRASVQQYYDLYIDILMRLGRQRPRSGFVALALEASEQAKARSLIEMLAESGSEIRTGIDPELAARARELQEEINDKTTEQIRLSADQRSATQAGAITDEITQLSAQYRETEAEIRRRNPHYAALVMPEPLTAQMIQNRVLDPGVLLLEYALGEERSYLWAVSRGKLRGYQLPKRAEIEGLARHYYSLLTARNDRTVKETAAEREARIIAADAESAKIGASLSRLLLGPVATELQRQQLIIVGDGALAYVPFAALPKPSVTGTGRRPLILDHEVINLPSASTLEVLRREMIGRTTAAKTLAIIADPVFEAGDERVKVVKIEPASNVTKDKPAETARAQVSDLTRILVTKSAKSAQATDAELRIPRLPFTRQEASAILKFAPPGSSDSAFDFAASRDFALSDELGKHRIVHFATHGFLNSSNPELSGLVLSLVNEKGAPQNGFLLAPEIYNLKLTATELVVLSACQTGLGKEVRGEGLVGMARGFMYAGAPRVVVSLWSVNDHATADLMQRFYRQLLARNARPAAALRRAQVALIGDKRWRAPYYWAAFGLQGETR